MNGGSLSISQSDGNSFSKAPLYDETRRLFHCINTHDFEELSKLCDDDFGIVDIDQEGKSKVIPDRTSWENWFSNFFAQMEAMEAEAYTEIMNYRVRTYPAVAWSVVDFCQHLKVQGQPMKYFCAATIVWKLTPDGWKEARWHCSLIDGPLPA